VDIQGVPMAWTWSARGWSRARRSSWASGSAVPDAWSPSTAWRPAAWPSRGYGDATDSVYLSSGPVKGYPYWDCMSSSGKLA